MNPKCPTCNVESVRHGSSFDCPQCENLVAITTTPDSFDEFERLQDENNKLREIITRYMRIEQDLLDDCARLTAKLQAHSLDEYDGIYRQIKAEQSPDIIDTHGQPPTFESVIIHRDGEKMNEPSKISAMFHAEETVDLFPTKKVLRTKASDIDALEIVEMTDTEIVQLLMNGESYIVSAFNKDERYDLEITDYDDYIE